MVEQGEPKKVVIFGDGNECYVRKDTTIHEKEGDFFTGEFQLIDERIENKFNLDKKQLEKDGGWIKPNPKFPEEYKCYLSDDIQNSTILILTDFMGNETPLMKNLCFFKSKISEIKIMKIIEALKEKLKNEIKRKHEVGWSDEELERFKEKGEIEIEQTVQEIKSGESGYLAELFTKINNQKEKILRLEGELIRLRECLDSTEERAEKKIKREFKKYEPVKKFAEGVQAGEVPTPQMMYPPIPSVPPQ